MENIDKLDTFSEFLNTIDEWNLNSSTEEILRQKDIEIASLKVNVAGLQAQLDVLMQYEASEKIVSTAVIWQHLWI
ncbi:hypothetical protein ACEN2P_08185 [Pedobacter psychrotolerans]|uniref:hypothetical protein n=1 Tax=Pedobacter psychrotolerans TaxID=1843235 RepID=UPI003F99F6C8